MQVKSLKNDFYRDNLKLVEDYVRLLNLGGLRLSVFFGSWVRGEATQSSDIDLLVVADSLSEDVRDNIYRLKMRGKYARIDCVGYQTEDFLRRLEKVSFFILDVLREGRIIYKDEGFYALIAASLRRLEERYGLRKEMGIWRFKPSSA